MSMTWEEILDRYSSLTIADNNPTVSSIQVAAAVIAAKELRVHTNLLRVLIQRLDSLGEDGIHLVIKHEAAKIRRRDRLRRKRLAAKRKAQREARKAVGA